MGTNLAFKFCFFPVFLAPCLMIRDIPLTKSFIKVLLGQEIHCYMRPHSFCFEDWHRHNQEESPYVVQWKTQLIKNPEGAGEQSRRTNRSSIACVPQKLKYQVLRTKQLALTECWLLILTLSFDINLYNNL